MTQQFRWNINTGAANITANNLTNITSTDVLIYVETNYTQSGVFKTNAFVNTSSYNDT